MIVRRLGIVVLVLAVGVAIGLAMPSWRMTTVIFAPGGRSWRIAGEAPRQLPATLGIDDDGRLRLRVINEDSIGHSAGVLAVAAHDSETVPADLCTGTHFTGKTTILLK